MITIQGKGVSAGVSIGPLYFYRRASTEVEHRREVFQPTPHRCAPAAEAGGGQRS